MLVRVLISIILCLRVTTICAQDLDISGAHASLDIRRARRCGTNGGYCLPVIRCRRIMGNRQFENPKMCPLQRGLPHMCCPVKLRSTIGPISSAPRPIPPNRPTPSRRPATNSFSFGSNPNGQRSIEINPTGCGRQVYVPAEGTDLVVGGREAVKYSWPWMAAIRSKNLCRRCFVCGGSLITRRHILTAAHCFDGDVGARPSSDFTVILGSHFRGSDRSYGQDQLEEGAMAVTVSAIAIHEGYNPDNNDNDIAVLLLDAEVPITDQINPICLPSRPGDRRDPSYVTVIGWGDLSYGGFGSRTLQEARFPVVPLSRCRRIFRRIFPNVITTNMLCAGDLTGRKDSCQNDSGGPLMTKNKEKNKWIQVGIVSFGYNCSIRGYPGVYTRVTNFVPWIRSNVRRLR